MGNVTKVIPHVSAVGHGSGHSHHKQVSCDFFCKIKRANRTYLRLIKILFNLSYLTISFSRPSSRGTNRETHGDLHRHRQTNPRRSQRSLKTSTQMFRIHRSGLLRGCTCVWPFDLSYSTEETVLITLYKCECLPV